MKTRCNFAALVACALLSFVSFANGQPTQERFDIQGNVTVQGEAIKIGDDTAFGRAP